MYRYGEARRLVWWIFLLSLAIGVKCQRHYFLRQPFNRTVRVGGSALMRCAVANIQTDVSWSVDGFGLGTSFADPRLSFAGSKSMGEYNLRIRDVELSDDGKYGCQVNADHSKKIDPLKSRYAYLTVIVPPTRIGLEPTHSGAIDVNLFESVTVTCTIPETKPASVLRWKVGGENYNGAVSRKLSSERGSKLVTTSSSITLQPAKSENGSTVECIVEHVAMDASVSRMATLNVLYPPSFPKISGFVAQPMRSGEELLLKCEAAGGNPLAKITWLIGDEIVSREYQHTKTLSQSLLRHTLRPQDNAKVLTCRVETPALHEYLQDQVKLEVQYPPEKIVIEREPEEGVQERGVITFTCQYADSNPRASLAWYMGDIKLPLHWNDRVTPTPYLIRNLKAENSASRISLTLTSVRRQDADLTITCRARIPEIGYVGQASTHPKINYPPRKVNVTIFSLSSPITISFNDAASPPKESNEVAYKAGEIIMLRCEAKGGNPAPTLIWYLGDKPVVVDEKTTISAPEVKVQTERNTGDSVYGEFVTATTMELTLEASHNMASVSCMAIHQGYKESLTDKRTLKVAFPPESLSVEQFPSSLVAGKPMSLTCTTTSSNPVPKITWYHNGDKLPSQNSIDLPHSKGSFGGFVSSSRLQLTPKVEDDGNDVTCKAETEILQETVTQPYQLNIEYPPLFSAINENDTSFNATEGDSYIQIEAIARANPAQMTFSWFRVIVGGALTLTKEPLTKDRRFVWSEDKGSLRVNGLKREDGGAYAVRASNSRGSTELNITLNVFYPPKIIRIAGPTTTLSEGDSTSLRCDYESHPLIPAYVKWVKEVPGIGRAEYDVRSFADHTILALANLTAADRGGYKCIVDNGVGEADSAHASLKLLHSPVFADSTPSKVAVSSVSDDGTLSPTAVLRCVVHSPPGITVVWLKGNRTITPTEENGYSILQEFTNSETTRSTLQVTRLYSDEVKQDGTDEVAEFTCVASNQLGRRASHIKIVLQGPPDAPSAPDVYNVTDSAINLVWRSGFDGGVRQEFIIHYKEYQKDMFVGSYKEVMSKTNHITIGDLDQNQEYIFRVMGSNSYGRSKPSESVRVKTASSMQQESKEAWDVFGMNKAYVIVLAVVSGSVLVFVIAIAVITFRRCKISKQSYKPKTIETDCESLTHAESSLSSRGSTGKRRGVTKLETEHGEERKLRIEDEFDGERRPLRDDEETTSEPAVTFEPAQSCYFDCSASGCSSRRSAENCDDPSCAPSSTCSMPPFNHQPIDRFKFGTQSARIHRPIIEERFVARNCSEPRLRVDVVPTDDCLASLQNKCCEASLDLPLPPALPLYERSYMNMPNMGSSCEALGACPYAGTQGNPIRSNFRQYRTLETAKFSHNRYYNDGCCGPVHDSSTSFIHSSAAPRDNFLPTTSTETCLYNVVSRPVESYGYGTSLLSMPGNTPDEYVVDVDESRVRGSHSSSSSNSGVYARSMDNMLNQQDGNSRQRASIVNDDGSINTFGFDLPPPIDSRTNTLDVIRESQSQDPLPSFCDYRDRQAAGNNLCSPSDTNGRFTGSRKSSLKGMTLTMPVSRRVPTASVRFRDELSRALSSPMPDYLRGTNQPSNEHSDDSDNDTDSGCGGSADVAVHSDPTPVSPLGDKKPAFTPVSSESNREEIVLRI